MMRSTPRMRIAGGLWLGCLQFFIVQQIVAAAWARPYSNTLNYISDLGALHCGYVSPIAKNYICSPLHAWINASMMLQGGLMAGGALLSLVSMQNRRERIARYLIAAAGLGSTLVGLFPEDVAKHVHLAAAALHLVCGNVGVVLLASGTAIIPPIVRRVVIALGGIGFCATVALGAGYFAGFGPGGMERIAVYPFPFSLMLFGVVLLSSRAVHGGNSAVSSD